MAAACWMLVVLCIPLYTSADSDFVIAVDAGSTHTKLFVYSFAARQSSSSTPPLSLPVQQASHKGEHALSDFRHEPELAGEACLKEVLAFAKTQIPSHKWSSTPFYLGATAGLRILPIDQREGIMASVRAYLHGSGFMFQEKFAKVLAGEEEGTFGWLTVNYLLGLFNAGPGTPSFDFSKSVGALDLGGASTQITYLPHTDPLANVFPFHLVDQTVNVYTHSYLKFGLNQAQDRVMQAAVANATDSVVEFPCLPQGHNQTYNASASVSGGPTAGIFTLTGSSDPEACRDLVDDLFLAAVPCFFGTSCSFDGVYQPPRNGTTFYAFSAFTYMASDLGWKSPITVRRFKNFSQTVCALDAAELQRDFSGKFIYSYCFSSIFISELLGTGYGFDEDETTITFADSVKGTELGWALGSVLYHANMLPWDITDESCHKTNKILVGLVVTIACLLAISLCWHCYDRRALKRNDVSYHPL